jgi:hypothetical protein
MSNLKIQPMMKTKKPIQNGKIFWFLKKSVVSFIESRSIKKYRRKQPHWLVHGTFYLHPEHGCKFQKVHLCSFWMIDYFGVIDPPFR